MSLFVPAVTRAEANANPLSAALWHFYRAQTSTPAPVYSDPDLTTEHPNPVEADGGGLFPPIYLDPGLSYRAVLKSALGVTVQDADPYRGGAATGLGASGSINILSIQANTAPGKTDFAGALEKAINLLTLTFPEGDWTAGGRIHFPPGRYYFSRTVTIGRTCIIQGDSSGGIGHAGGQATIFYAAPDTTCLRVIHTAGGKGHGAGTIIQNIFFVGSGTSRETAGIFVTGRAFISDCGAMNFGNGIWVHGELNPADPPVGDASLFQITRGRFVENRDCGIKITGGDANAFKIEGADCVANANWGIKNVSFLGGEIEACHTSLNGIVGVGGRTLHALCTYGGFEWAVIAGYETAASTEAPGTGTAWARKGRDFVSEGFPRGVPTWTRGKTWMAGGPYANLSGAAHGNLLLNCYSEAGQGPSQIAQSPGFALQGTHGAGVIGTYVNGNQSRMYSTGGWCSKLPVREGGAAGWTDLQWGGPLVGSGFVTSYESEHSGGRFVTSFVGSKAHLAFGLLNGNTAFTITSGSSTEQFGRGAAQTGKLHSEEIFLGSADARAVAMGPAAPSAGRHAKGEVVFNNGTNAANDAVDYWRCTASGTPGTWVARP
jgi:hypothetical protein